MVKCGRNEHDKFSSRLTAFEVLQGHWAWVRDQNWEDGWSLVGDGNVNAGSTEGWAVENVQGNKKCYFCLWCKTMRRQKKQKQRSTEMNRPQSHVPRIKFQDVWGIPTASDDTKFTGRLWESSFSTEGAENTRERVIRKMTLKKWLLVHEIWQHAKEWDETTA